MEYAWKFEDDGKCVIDKWQCIVFIDFCYR